MHRLLHEVSEHEGAVRVSLELSSAVRDQYAHQAHTIILGNASHLPLYEAAQRRVSELNEAVSSRAKSATEKNAVAEIEAKTRDLDSLFRSSILPSVLAENVEATRTEHSRAQHLVSAIQQNADALAASFEASIEASESHAALVEHAALRWLVALVLGSLVFALFVAIYLTRSITRPIDILSRGAARIGAGDLDTRIQLEREDEFGILAGRLNAMAASLKEDQRRLLESERLAGVGRLAAGVAHEINNPLGVILGYARMIRRRSSGQLADDLAIVEDEAMRCQEIVEGLLDLSRTGLRTTSSIELADLCTEIVERIREAAQLGDTTISVNGSSVVRGDPGKLRQVFLNLIKNATEAVGGRGNVSIAIRGAGDSTEVLVADSGPGIPADVRDRLFEPFFSTKDKGTGLGLAVSKAILEAHGGSIEAVDGTFPGAAFRVLLPNAPEAR